MKSYEGFVVGDIDLGTFADLFVESLNNDIVDPSGVSCGCPLWERNEDSSKKFKGNEKVLGISQEVRLQFGAKMKTLGIHFHEGTKRYPSEIAGKKRMYADYFMRDNSENELWVELKTNWESPCTTYVTDFSLEEYIFDIKKLRSLSDDTKKMMILLAFRPDASYPTGQRIPSAKISAEVGSDPVWKWFDMPTKMRGPCVAHLLFWAF